MTNQFTFTMFSTLVAAVAAFSSAFSSTEASAQCHFHRRPVYVQPVHHHPVLVNRYHTQSAVATPQPAVSREVNQAKNKTDAAKAFFKTKQYADAQRQLDAVVKLAPKDTNAFQFRSLALFAQGKYGDAAADAYDAVSLGNTWTTKVLNSVYANGDHYRQQLANLKKEVEANPSMPTHFLLAYHYLVLNDLENGRAELEQVLELQPEEPLSTQLLAAVMAKLNPVAQTQ